MDLWLIIMSYIPIPLSPYSSLSPNLLQERSLDSDTEIFDKARQRLIDARIKTPLRTKHPGEIMKEAKLKLRGYLMWLRRYRDMINYGKGMRFVESKISVMTNARDFLASKTMVFPSKEFKLAENMGCLFPPNCKFKQIWNLVVLVLLIYVFIGTPWVIAFEDVVIGSPLFFFELFVDFLFFVDILITLNSAFYANEHLVTNRKTIFMNYLTGMLLIDILAIFPFYLFEIGEAGKSNSLVRIIRITKVSRVFRASKLLKVVKHLSNSDSMERFIKFIRSYDGIARLITIAFIITIMAHFVACMWYFSAKLNDLGPETWVVRNGFADSSKGRLYLASLYWAFAILTTVGFGDIYAFNSTEMIACILWMLFGIGFYSFLVGTLSSVLSRMDTKQNEKQKIILEIEEFGKICRLSKPIVKKMKSELCEQKNEIMNKNERVQILKQTTQELHYEVCMAMYDDGPSKIKFFKEQSKAFIMYIVPRLEFMVLEGYVYRKLDHADYIYFLSHGKVDYVVGEDEYAFMSILNGGFFGETELIEKCLRLFTVIADGVCNALTINRTLFDEIQVSFPKTASELHMLYEKRRTHYTACMDEMLDLVEAIIIRRDHTCADLEGQEKLRHRNYNDLNSNPFKTNPVVSVKAELIQVKDTLEELKTIISSHLNK